MSDPNIGRKMPDIPVGVYGLLQAEEALLSAFLPRIPGLDEAEINFIRNRVQHELLALAFRMLEHMPAVQEFIITHREELKKKEETDGA